MNKILISIPNQLASRMRAIIPQRQRSKIIGALIELEVKKRERALYKCAAEVENDLSLNKEMEDWDVALKDGLTDESW